MADREISDHWKEWASSLSDVTELRLHVEWIECGNRGLSFDRFYDLTKPFVTGVNFDFANWNQV